MVPGRTALVICDVWDNHWCKTAAARTARLATAVNAVVPSARRRGLVIHAPSDTMAFYEGTAQRTRAVSVPVVTAPLEKDLDEPPYSQTNHPGCPDEPNCVSVEAPPWPWTRQHSAIDIGEDDLISDRGDEIYNTLEAFSIDTVAFAGVHTDLCVLDRPFGLRQMRRWGVDCVVLGDLTEAFWPEETASILRHIDDHLCPVWSSHEVF